MKDTRDMINDMVNQIWQDVTSRLCDKDDDFEYAYANYAGEDELISKFNWWIRGNAMYVQKALSDYETDLDAIKFTAICRAIGYTYISKLVGENKLRVLDDLLDRELEEINELYNGGDEHDQS